MSSSWKLIVLCPTGHRVTVKVSRETPILQVLTEACQRRALDPDLHRLRHHNTILDNGLSIRFANLPNNATLDLVQVESEALSAAAAAGHVRVAVDLEGQGRAVLQDISVQSDLYSVLQKADATEKGKDGEEPVVVYMRTEIVGAEALKKTTLVQLGVTSGSLALKLFYKKPDLLKDQARVINQSLHQSRPPRKAEVEWRPMKKDCDITLSKIVPTTQASRKARPCDGDVASQQTSSREDQEESEPAKEAVTVVEATPKVCEVRVDVDEQPEVLRYFGGGNAVVFEIGEGSSRKSMQRLSQLSDDFFELSIDDIKMIHRDNQRKVAEMQEGEQLLTKSMKKAQHEGRKLQTMNKYKKCLIRVTFAQEGLVVQGVFSPAQTVGDVKRFLKEYLALPNLQFHLFTGPPRKVLDAETTLLDNDCVPAAVLHFQPEERTQDQTFLKPEVRNNLSNGAGVERAVKEAELIRRGGLEQSVGLSSSASSSSSLASVLEEGQGVKRSSETLKRTPDDKKIPKCFRSGK